MISTRAASVTLVLAASVLATACSTSSRSAEDPTLAVMNTHFGHALELRTHAVSGNLTRFRASAATLADLRPTGDLSPEVFLQFGPLRYEAELASGARTGAAAALAAAEVARTCGDCHVANGVALAQEPARTMARPSDASLATHMETLSLVTRQLWSGLVTPSEAQWLAGVAGLVGAGALPDGLAGRVPVEELAFASRRLARLAEEASEARHPRHRVRVLGEIWGTCSDCHTQVGTR